MQKRSKTGAIGNVRLTACLAVVAAAAALCSSAASAEDWTTDLKAYLFLPWADFGVETAGGATLETSLDPGDLVEALKFGLMFAGDTHRGKTSLLYDIFYTDLDFSGSLAAPVPVNVDTNMKLLLASFGVGYDLERTKTGFVQVFGGLRYVKLDNSVTLSGTGTPAAVVGLSRSDDYLEPLVGLRGRTQVGDRTSLGGYMNVGGFGVGSEFTFDGYVGLDYAISDTKIASAGVRYLSIDYEAGNADLDVDMLGPVIGLAWKF